MLEKDMTKTGVGYAISGTSLADMRMGDRIDAPTAKALYSTAGSSISYFQSWWPGYNYTIREVRSKFEDAFKIVALLIEKGHLKNIRLKQFIQIVKEVEAEL